MNNVVILGSRGMLGAELVKIFPACLAWDKQDLDLTDFETAKLKIQSLNPLPEVLVNCAAYNDVDGAESKPEWALKLNAEVPGNLATLCKNLNIPLVHFSTNYIFDGAKQEYLEQDEPNPLSVYGQSKWQGEQLVAQNTEKFYIIRTAGMFGPKGASPNSKKSFVDVMLGLAAQTQDQSQEIKAINDEINSFTYSADLAAEVKKLLAEKKPYGIYHITNSGSASWYDLACEIFSLKKIAANVVPVAADSFPRLAKRPKQGILSSSKLQKLRSWQEALREFLNLKS